MLKFDFFPGSVLVYLTRQMSPDFDELSRRAVFTVDVDTMSKRIRILCNRLKIFQFFRVYDVIDGYSESCHNLFDAA